MSFHFGIDESSTTLLATQEFSVRLRRNISAAPGNHLISSRLAGIQEPVTLSAELRKVLRPPGWSPACILSNHQTASHTNRQPV